MLSKGKTLADHETLASYFERIGQLPGLNEFRSEEEKSAERVGFKPWFAVLGN